MYHLMLDYPVLGAVAQTASFFGPGLGSIHLGGVQCVGMERNLSACPNGSTAGCSHANDAGVTCQTSKITQWHVNYIAG